MTALSLQGINKHFGKTQVLSDVSLEVESGTFVALLGASGSGKSTLLRIIAGLEAPDDGQVRINDLDVTRASPDARDLAMVFQAYALYPQMTAASNIGLGLEMRRLRPWQRLPFMRHLPKVKRVRESIDADVAAAAKMVGMSHLLDRKPWQLSGGQRQRAALARAMVRHPRLLLMDEPLSNLDAKLRQKMRAEIADLHARTGATVIYVTHDQIEAMTLATQVAVMVEGRIIQSGSPQTLYADPDDIRVAEMLGSPQINVLEGVRTDCGIMAGGLPWCAGHSLAKGAIAHVGFRAELACLSAAEDDVPAARLRRIERLGSESLLHLAMPDGQPAIVRAEPSPSFGIGDRIQLQIDPAALLIFDGQGCRVRETTA